MTWLFCLTLTIDIASRWYICDWLLKRIHIWLYALFPSNTLHISNLYRIKSWLRIGCVLTQWLWPCGRHFEEVTSRWPRSLGSDVTSCDVIWKILKIIFLLYFCNLGNFTSFWHHSSIFIFFIKWRHLKWLADGHVIRSDVTSQVTSIKIQVTVISSSDEQMARANNLLWVK